MKGLLKPKKEIVKLSTWVRGRKRSQTLGNKVGVYCPKRELGLKLADRLNIPLLDKKQALSTQYWVVSLDPNFYCVKGLTLSREQLERLEKEVEG